jgi:hypothetical protein
MKKNILLFIFSLLCTFNFAATPNWQVQANEFSKSMTIVGVVSVSGTFLNSENNMVAAFVGDECRGMANILYSDAFSKHFVYLMIFANEESEDVSFKIYDNNSDRIITVTDQIEFNNDISMGSQTAPYLFTNNTVNQNDIISISVNIDGAETILSENGSLVEIVMPSNADISAVAIDFEVSEYATIYLDGQLYLGELIDLSTNRIFQIVAQNGESRSVTVSTSLDETSQIYETKSNKIEVYYTTEKNIIIDNKYEGRVCKIFDNNGKLILSKKIEKNEIILSNRFNNLYVINISDF